VQRSRYCFDICDSYTRWLSKQQCKQWLYNLPDLFSIRLLLPVNYWNARNGHLYQWNYFGNHRPVSKLPYRRVFFFYDSCWCHTPNKKDRIAIRLVMLFETHSRISTELCVGRIAYCINIYERGLKSWALDYFRIGGDISTIFERCKHFPPHLQKISF